MKFTTVSDGCLVIFGRGTAVGKITSAIQHLGGITRILILCEEGATENVTNIADHIDVDIELSMCCDAPSFESEVSVPQELVEKLLEQVNTQSVDCILAYGGASSIGIAKALNVAAGCKFIAIPTTYSGAECSNVVEITHESGRAVTQKDDLMRPKVIIYDSIYTDNLPYEFSVNSAFHAMSHVVEALWCEESDPLTKLSAEEGFRIILEALPGLKETKGTQGPAHQAVRDELLYGAFLGGTALRNSKMAIHHKICDVLASAFNLPQSQVHSVLLPHTLYYNREFAPDAFSKMAKVIGEADVGGAIFDLNLQMGGVWELQSLGFTTQDIDRATEIIFSGVALYDNPRPMEADSISDLLLDAYLGRRPTYDNVRTEVLLTNAIGAHAALESSLRGCALNEAEAVIICVHENDSSADAIIHKVESALGDFWHKEKVSYVAPQAADSAWFPSSPFDSFEENGPRLESAMDVLQNVLESVQETVQGSKIILLGLSQGASLVMSLVAKYGPADIAAVVCLKGALMGSEEDFAQYTADDLKDARLIMGVDRETSIPTERLETTYEILAKLEANVQIIRSCGDVGTIHEQEASAIRSVLTPLLMPLSHDGLFEYLYGLGGAHTSEARAGAVPTKQFNPADSAQGLYCEVLTGSSFVAPRSENQRSWLYKIHPSVANASAFRPAKETQFTSNFSERGFKKSPEPLRWKKPTIPTGVEVDFVDGITTIAGCGDAGFRSGMAVHQFVCNADMEDRSFYNADGSMCLIPHLGELIVITEFGRMHVRVGELFVIPRGLKFTVQVFSPQACGWIAESFGAHFKLPERGLLGGHGLAEERHFAIPTAWYEDRPCPGYRLTAKYGGELHESTLQHSPYDVCGWHGNYYPYKYNMHLFKAFGSVTTDHSDPSIHTILTVPADERGNNAVDVAAFVPRWDPTLHTFRPPYYHRNQATEFNGIVKMSEAHSGFEKGGSFLTPSFTAHGISTTGTKANLGANNGPTHGSPDDGSLWIMFESCFQMSVAPWASSDDCENKDGDYRSIYAGLERLHCAEEG